MNRREVSVRVEIETNGDRCEDGRGKYCPRGRLGSGGEHRCDLYQVKLARGERGETFRTMRCLEDNPEDEPRQEA